MRKIWTAIFMFFCITCLTGCMRFNTTVKIKSNGKADVTMLYAISTEFSKEDLSGYMTMPEEEMQKMLDEGWECNEYSQDNYLGYEFVKRDVELQELSESFNDAGDGSTINADDFKISKKGLNYAIDWKVFEDEDMSDISSYKNYFDMAGGYMTFTMELPFKPASSNATTVSEDGKTLTWDLLELGEGQTIHVEFSVINIRMILFYMAIVVSTLIIIVIIVIVILLNKKKKQYMPMQQAQGYQGFADGAVPSQGVQNTGTGATSSFNEQNLGESNTHQPGTQSFDTGNESLNKSVADEIMKLKNLMDSGVITAEEFEAQKKKLLEQ